MQKPFRPRVSHTDARLLVEGVLQRLDNLTPHLLHVERLIVFGSFAYGLLDVDDIDLAINYTRTMRLTASHSKRPPGPSTRPRRQSKCTRGNLRKTFEAMRASSLRTRSWFASIP